MSLVVAVGEDNNILIIIGGRKSTRGSEHRMSLGKGAGMKEILIWVAPGRHRGDRCGQELVGDCI